MRRKNWIVFVISIVMVMALSSNGYAQSGSGSSKKLSITYSNRPFLSFLPLHIAQDEGLFAAENVDVTLKTFRRGSEAVAALIANETDTISATDESSLNIILRGLDIKTIFPQSIVVGNGKSQAICIRKDLYDKGLRSAKDLKGLTIAWLGGWSALPYAGFKTMEKRGVSVAKDMTIKRIRRNPAKIAALEKGAIDAAVFSEPWITIAKAKGVAVPLFYMDTPAGLPTSMLAFKGEFVRNNHDGVLRFLRAYIKAVKIYQSVQTVPARKREYSERYAKKYGLKVDDMAGMYWSDLSSDGKFNKERVQDWMNWVAKGGSVKGVVKVSQWHDPSFINELKKEGILP